jgi:hypothetical protein
MPPRPRQIEFIAQKELQANHRIVDGDIAESSWKDRFFFLPSLTTRESFVGRYMYDCVRKGDQLEIEDTLSGPNLVASASKPIVWIPLADLPAADIMTLDVDGLLSLCDLDGKGGCPRYRVKAITCDLQGSGMQTCFGAVEITKQDLPTVVVALQRTRATVADASPKPGGTPSPSAGTPKPVTSPAMRVITNYAPDENGMRRRLPGRRCETPPPRRPR